MPELLSACRLRRNIVQGVKLSPISYVQGVFSERMFHPLMCASVPGGVRTASYDGNAILFFACH